MVTLPLIISSGMVLERKARLWGACDGETVRLAFRGREYRAKTVKGRWSIDLDAGNPGGPFELSISEHTLTDVYVGRVFLCCGQSNMETPVSRVRLMYGEDFVNVENPRIRAFQVEKAYDWSGPREDCGGCWRGVSNDNIDTFYAVPYYLARRLEAALNIPIGVVECAAGGSRIESWLPESSVRDVGYVQELLKLCNEPGFPETVTESDGKRRDAWHTELNRGDTGLTEGYYNDDYDCKTWPAKPLTKAWDGDLSNVNGSVWFRRSFDVSEESAGQAGRLWLGRITDSDQVWVNGQCLGQTEYRHPPRVYPIPAGLLRLHDNTVTVRVVSERGEGGFTAGKPYKVETAAGEAGLDGEWRYKISCGMPTLAAATWLFAYPCGLYNAMLHPVLPYRVSAFLWYQGESNDRSPYGYGRLLNRLVREVREALGLKLPFLAVQLPNYDAGELNAGWDIIRKEQAAVLEQPNTALIITNDIGEDNDLHPLNKRDVGERLAAGVLRLIRGDRLNTDKVLISKDAY